MGELAYASVGSSSRSQRPSFDFVTVSEGATTFTRTYDERGRLKTFTTADGDLIQYKYDANNNLTRLTYPPDTVHPSGKQVSYTYNALNLLATVTDWSGRLTTYTYDRLGRVTGTIRPNGTSNQIAHDAATQLTSIKESAGGKLINYLAFQYDAASQIKSRFRAPFVNSGWQHPTFAATYDDNRLLTVNGQTVTHDADGNMTYGPIAGSAGVSPTFNNLTYNSRNQLTIAAGVSYNYDAEGRRRSFTDVTGTTREVIDPSGKLLIRIQPGGVKTHYVYGRGLLYEANQADATKTYHFDQFGSTLLRTDDSGKVIGQAEYSSYGLTTWKQGDMATPFLYNGQAGVQTDPNGLLNMRARYYSPYLMRFLNADPIGFSGGPNWFAYADGNPISLSDPFGLCADRNACTGGTGRGGGSVPFPDLSPITNSILGVTRSIGDQNPWIGEAISAVSYNLTLEALGPNPGMFFEGLVVKGAQAAKGGMTLADDMAVLRQATTGKGNFGVGAAGADDAARLGRSWVGEGAEWSSSGKALVSPDGLRQFRPPSLKPNSPYATTGSQANFEWRNVPSGQWQGNGHLNITPP